MTKRQAAGMAVVVFLVVLRVVASAPYGERGEAEGIPYGRCLPGTMAVEIAGRTGQDGIYHLPAPVRAEECLVMAGIRPDPEAVSFFSETVLPPATTIEAGPEGRMRIRPMAAARRLFLGIPLDLRRATREDLILVAGIGEKTADAIVRFRENEGGIDAVEDLLRIRGIGEKRLAALRPFLCVGERCESAPCPAGL